MNVLRLSIACISIPVAVGLFALAQQTDPQTDKNQQKDNQQQDKDQQNQKKAQPQRETARD